MIIRKYIVNNMSDAMLKIKNDLGSEATIISSKKVKKPGIFGIFKERMIEVTAACEKKNEIKEETNKRNSTEYEMQSQINDLKKMIEGLSRNIVSSSFEIAVTKDSKYVLIDRLLHEGVDELFLSEIENSIKFLIESSDEKVLESDINQRILDSIENLVQIKSETDDRIKVLVGPTGVGKTTTIAKLASMYTLYKKKKVGLITLDTYRIGAVEQLKTYAEILNIPFEVVISSNDVESALNNMDSCDVIFVDTTGRNGKNHMQISEIKNIISKFNPSSVDLVVSTTTKNEDIKFIIENYSSLNYNSIILTKVDETNTYGGIINSLYYSNKPISYICTGQDVPSDIFIPTKEKVINLLLGDKNNGSSC